MGLLFYGTNKEIFTKRLFVVRSMKRSKKRKMTYKESLKVISTSRLALGICSIVLFYNILTNLIEITYKNCLKAYAIAINASVSSVVIRYQSVMQICTGSIVMVLLFSPFSEFVKIFGWKVVGLITPISMFCTSTVVFILAIYNVASDEKGFTFFSFFRKESGISTAFLRYELISGLISVMLLKAFKYSAFDIAKEALSMRIDPIHRARFKGVYDGVCGKLGKAGNSVLSVSLAQIFNIRDQRETAPLSILVSIVFCGLWVHEVFYLGNKYNRSIEEDDYIDIDTAEIPDKK